MNVTIKTNTMKTILGFKFLIIFSIMVNAQSPIVPLLDFANPDRWADGVYHKDVNNDMDKFVGEWLWQDDNSSFTLKFGKEVMVERFLPASNIIIFQDLLYGEYRYIENGVEMINTLPLFENVAQPWQHNISGQSLLGTNHYPICKECTADEIRIILSFTDPNRNYIKSRLILRHGVQWWDQQEYIIAFLYTTWSPAGSEFKVNTVPSGTYTLYKQ